jgi:urea transport system permease protein
VRTPLPHLFSALLITLFLGNLHAFADEDKLQILATQLAGASFSDIERISNQLEGEVGEAALPVLSVLLAGDLYYHRQTKKLMTVATAPDREFHIFDFFSGEALGTADRRTIKKVRTHNSLRSHIRGIVARLNLFSTDSQRRLAAAKSMLGEIEGEELNLLKTARLQEQNRKVRKQMDLALNLYVLKNGEPTAKLNVVEDLAGSLEPEVRNAFQELLTSTDPHKDSVLIAALKSAQNKSSGRVEFFNFLNTLFFGLSLGSVLLLVAAGLAITFGVMGVINMAHGELIMLGAYSTYVVQLLMPNHVALSIIVAIPVAFLVSGLVGILIERGVIRFLKGRPLETLLATFGISLILQQTVRSIFSPLNRTVISPEWLSGSLEINPVFSLTYNRLYILLFALIVFALLQLIMKKTSLGLRVRAVSQNRYMAKAIGIRTEWVDAMTFGLGSGIAGVAGVALALITNVGPNLGQSYIIDSFMVVVFGGVGNLWGTLVGGFSLGIANKFLEPATGAVLANILVLVFIILFIQKRPRGLFPQKGRAAE